MSAIKIQLYGMLSEIADSDYLIVKSSRSIKELKQNLYSVFPDMRRIPCTVSVDNRIVEDDYVIENEKEIALMPPFSGG